MIAISVGGLNVYQLTLTAQSRKPNCMKKYIYIQARVHAAENHSSFVMKNFIE